MRFISLICLAWISLAQAQPQLKVQQQRLVLADDHAPLREFLLSQQQLQDFSIALISQHVSHLQRVVNTLQGLGVSDERIQIRHDLRQRIKADEQDKVIAIVEWFQPQQLNCAEEFGCANRSNLLQMLAQPRHGYRGERSASGIHGRDAVEAAQYQRNNRDLPGDRRTSLTMEGS